MTRGDRAKGLVIVTGGTRGIGAAVAASAARDGHAVLANFATRSAEVFVRTQRSEGLDVSCVQADLADERGVLTLFEAADRLERPLCGLVNNAAVTGGFSRLEDLRADALRNVLAINVEGCFLCAREAVRRLSTAHGGPGGSIVNVSSIAAKLGGAGEWIHYAASKAALETLTVGLAREVAGEGIRVNAVAAGFVETGLHAAAGEPERLKRVTPGIPIGRPGTAEEIARTILWLMSDAASYVTGAVLAVGGGR